MHSPRKSLAPPENSGHKKSLPCYGCLISNTDIVRSREEFPAPVTVESTQGLTSPGLRCHHPRHHVLLSTAVEVQAPGSSSCRGDTVSLSSSRKKCRVYIKKATSAVSRAGFYGNGTSEEQKCGVCSKITAAPGSGWPLLGPFC